MKKLVGVTLGLLISLPAEAGAIYQWVDDGGQRHFGDRPPAGVPVQPVEVQPATGGESGADSGLRAGERARLREIENQERIRASEKRAQFKRAAAEEGRRGQRAERDARSCAGYKQKIRDYERRLRGGCRVSRCNSHNEQIARLRDKAELVCR